MERPHLIVLALGEPGPETIMKHYFFYIHDQRYTVPQFLVVDAANDDDAVELARKSLADSRHYLSIDIVDGERDVTHVHR